MGWEGLNWIHLAQDRDKWQALVNTVMNHKILYFSDRASSYTSGR